MQSLKAVLKDRNFLIYWAGTAVSVTGDAVTVVALPWLILRLTDDAGMLGLVLGLQALPRALLMLFGGVAADHFSPRRVLMMARGLSIFVLFALGMLVVTGAIQEWMVYPFALVLGTIGAFQIPAGTSIVPTLVPSEELRAANSAVTSTMRLAMILGPTLAGLLIGLFGDTELTGVGYAFLIDSVTFVFSTASLMFVVARGADGGPSPAMSVMKRLKQGLAYAWGDTSIRSILLFTAAANFFSIGVAMVGLPVYADSVLPLGAKGYGYLISALGGGSLLGSVLAAALPSPPEGRAGFLLFPLSSVIGVLFVAFPFIDRALDAVVLVGVMGVISGYTNIFFLTWLQQRIESSMIGRIMSIVSLGSLGVMPVAMAISGYLIELIGLTALFIGSGLMMAIAALSCLSVPSLRALSAKEAAADNVQAAAEAPPAEEEQPLPEAPQNP